MQWRNKIENYLEYSTIYSPIHLPQKAYKETNLNLKSGSLQVVGLWVDLIFLYFSTFSKLCVTSTYFYNKIL